MILSSNDEVTSIIVLNMYYGIFILHFSKYVKLKQIVTVNDKTLTYVLT